MAHKGMQSAPTHQEMPVGTIAGRNANDNAAAAKSGIFSVISSLLSALQNAICVGQPYQHWLLREILPMDVCRGITGLPIDPADIRDTQGKRETHNSQRHFFSPNVQKRFQVCRSVASAFQGIPVVKSFEAMCGVSLEGSSVRIEYCQDRNGFWLEPHTDISVKLLTLQIYLNEGIDAFMLGTDVYESKDRLYTSVPGVFNYGMLFIPGSRTWHGFKKRPIYGVRKSIIINYVTQEWRARHELCYPDQPVGEDA